MFTQRARRFLPVLPRISVWDGVCGPRYSVLELSVSRGSQKNRSVHRKDLLLSRRVPALELSSAIIVAAIIS
jgi:hypothetical protein